MGLVICPECKSRVSQYAELCPGCGFPIKSFMTENHFDDINKVFVCPLCAKIYYGSKNEFQPLYLKCEFCNTTVIPTDEDEKEIYQLCCKKYEKEYEAKKIDIAKKYGGNRFSQDEYDKSVKKTIAYNAACLREREQAEQQKSQIKCPYCNSSNTTKITNIQRGLSAYLFGLSSSKLGKQWHCNNCNSDF